MAYYSFTEAILQGRPIDVFNHGDMKRDFTYIDDIVEGVVRVLDRVPDAKAGEPLHHVFNIGHHSPVQLMDFIATLERHLGRKAQTRMLPMQPGDVPATYADVDALAKWVGFRPSTSLDEGLGRFAAWYRNYHGESA
jgi:UDP-glucuronate 4-epimerase